MLTAETFAAVAASCLAKQPDPVALGTALAALAPLLCSEHNVTSTSRIPLRARTPVDQNPDHAASESTGLIRRLRITWTASRTTIRLAECCRQRTGVIQVCEAAGADWLPFQTFAIVGSHRPDKFAAEAMYELSSPGGADPAPIPVPEISRPTTIEVRP